MSAVMPGRWKNLEPPIVILPMSDWNKMSQKGIRFALKLSSDILVVQVRATDKMDPLRGDENIVVVNVPWYLRA